MTDIIDSFVEGRVRLRSPLFADVIFAERLTAELLKIDEVLSVKVNRQTRGMLLEYDKTRLPMSALLRAAPLLSRLNELEDFEGASFSQFIDDLRGALGKR
jgi:hypothetical protein